VILVLSVSKMNRKSSAGGGIGGLFRPKSKNKKDKTKPVHLNAGIFHLRIGDEEALDPKRLAKQNAKFLEDYNVELEKKEVQKVDNKIFSLGSFHIITEKAKAEENGGVSQGNSWDVALGLELQSELGHLKQYHWEVLTRWEKKQQVMREHRAFVETELLRLRDEIARKRAATERAEKEERELLDEIERHGQTMEEMEVAFDGTIKNVRANHDEMLGTHARSHETTYQRERSAHSQLEATAHRLTAQIKEREQQFLQRKNRVGRQLEKERLALIDELTSLKQTNALQVRELLAAEHLFHQVNNERQSRGEPPLNLKQELRGLLPEDQWNKLGSDNQKTFFHAYTPEEGDEQTGQQEQEGCVIA